MTFLEYAAIPAVNWSLLKEMAKSPAHYQYRRTHPREDTAAMLLGRLVHCAVLEPDELPKRWAVWNGARRGNAWVEFAEATVANGVETCTEAEYEKALAIRDAVRGHVAALPLLYGGKAEVVKTWTDPSTGVPCKARLDYLIGQHTLVELKTTRDIGPREFARTCAYLSYHGQLAFYARALSDKPEKYVKAYVIAVESEPPHDVCVYEPDEDFMWAGDELVSELLAKLKQCERTGQWPGAYKGLRSLALPPWVFDRLDETT